jgi:F1F0 ATPase subunit 2
MDWLPLLWSVLAGIALALFYFGGLWMTVQRLPTTRSPALLAFASFLVRMVVLLLALYLVIDGRFDRLVALLLSFFLTRQVLLFRLRPGRQG